ncbi:uncharacterized protein LOC122568270 [Bombus pyrosoma]|uniref:uncharacterized protein LOC122568270 n=1 Tax=Bombus pyrosoma TaxID=396416 RepID=UPI001CB958DD|nr:uncharacterized protein LOC122568270 [Bombus pyrosoma]
MGKRCLCPPLYSRYCRCYCWPEVQCLRHSSRCISYFCTLPRYRSTLPPVLDAVLLLFIVSILDMYSGIRQQLGPDNGSAVISTFGYERLGPPGVQIPAPVVRFFFPRRALQNAEETKGTNSIRASLRTQKKKRRLHQ